jgi:hypothetical protein
VYLDDSMKLLPGHSLVASQQIQGARGQHSWRLKFPTLDTDGTEKAGTNLLLSYGENLIQRCKWQSLSGPMRPAAAAN